MFSESKPIRLNGNTNCHETGYQRSSPIRLADELMQYPPDFPPESRAAVAAEKLRAGDDFDQARENLPQMQYGSGQHLEAELRRYILRQFGVFVSEACTLGHKGIWDVDRVEKEALEFLRRSTIDARYSKGYDKSGRAFGGDWISNWDGAIQPEVQRQFERSGEWKQFQDALLKVAEDQAARTSDIGKNTGDATAEVVRDSAQSERAGGIDTERDLSKRSYGTSLGRNLDRLKRESGWSFEEMAMATGFDKKLILGHVNQGKNAYPSTVATYARIFTEKLGRPVTVAELEG